MVDIAMSGPEELDPYKIRRFGLDVDEKLRRLIAYYLMPRRGGWCQLSKALQMYAKIVRRESQGMAQPIAVVPRVPSKITGEPVFVDSWDDGREQLLELLAGPLDLPNAERFMAVVLGMSYNPWCNGVPKDQVWARFEHIIAGEDRVAAEVWANRVIDMKLISGAQLGRVYADHLERLEIKLITDQNADEPSPPRRKQKVWA